MCITFSLNTISLGSLHHFISLSLSIHPFLFPFHWCWPGIEQFPCSPLLDAPFFSNSLILLSQRLFAIHSPPSFHPVPSIHPFVLPAVAVQTGSLPLSIPLFLLPFVSIHVHHSNIPFIFSFSPSIPPSLHVIGYNIALYPFILPSTPPSVRPSQIEVL